MKEPIELIGVYSNAVADAQNTAFGNQTGSHPGIDGVYAESIPGSKLRDFQVHTRCPQFHQITTLRQKPENSCRLTSLRVATGRITSRFLAGMQEASLR
jgi:hypothetical protein